MPSPKDFSASACVASTVFARSSGLSTRRMPMPPPPADALTSSGKPTTRAASSRPARSPGAKRALPGRIGTPAARASRRARSLSPMSSIDFGRRADPGQAGPRHRLGEVAVLGEEAVAGMHGIGARRLGRRQDVVADEIALLGRRRADRLRLIRLRHMQRPGIGLGVDRDRLQAERAAAADDAAGDLAAIGDQHLLHRLALAPSRRAGQFRYGLIASFTALATATAPGRVGMHADAVGRHRDVVAVDGLDLLLGDRPHGPLGRHLADPRPRARA